MVTESGEELGKVKELFATGANDVLVVSSDEKEHLIPYVDEEFIIQVDLDAGKIVVRWDPEF